MDQQPTSLTLAEELNNCYYLFIEAFSLTIESYTEEESIKIKEFLASLGRSYNPYSLMTVSHVTDLIDLIFTKEDVRDFIWKLTFNFFSILGYDKGQYNKLCETLAFSLNVTDNYKKTTDLGRVEKGIFSLTPDTLKSKLEDYETIKEYLIDNKWLIVITIIILNYRRQYPGTSTIMKMVEG